MKKILILIILAAVLFVVLYKSYEAGNIHAKKIVFTLKLEKLFFDIKKAIYQQMKSLNRAKDAVKVNNEVETPPAGNAMQPVTENTATLYLKNGAVISGKLLRETGNAYVIKWEGGEVTFYADEVESIDRGVEKKE